ncbi:hypothetical protein N7493_008759 [Penicillium malachiteum]|uniref:Uncharacterized protein n=1 Tax=Penicillium malachiteum TaxID=1324776 RepID=A0AAD6MSQ9_9EURO|nr:hypothetical protein N7493_008759 [Penicillium malachiteum]
MEQLEDEEQEDDYFIVDDEEDFLQDVESSSQTVGNTLYSDEEDVQSSSSESDDSADESYDDCSYAETPGRGRSRSRVAETPAATARVTRSHSRHPLQIGVAVDHLLQSNWHIEKEADLDLVQN